MDFDDIMCWIFGISILSIFFSVSALVGFNIYKEIHCWGLDPATAPIECQSTNTVNVNGID